MAFISSVHQCMSEHDMVDAYRRLSPHKGGIELVTCQVGDMQNKIFLL